MLGGITKVDKEEVRDIVVRERREKDSKGKGKGESAKSVEAPTAAGSFKTWWMKWRDSMGSDNNGKGDRPMNPTNPTNPGPAS